jgi:hypothetical protein
MNWNPRFLQLSRQAFNPFLPSSGTENVACLLYAIARMLRPRTIVEYGSGYTTLYLLAALAENTSDAKEEGTLLRAKTEKLTEREIVFSRASPNGRDATQKRRELEWFSSGDKACGVDPGFFRQAYMPRLYSIERLSSDHDYSKRLLKTVMELDLAEFLTYLTGCEFSPHILPAEAFPLDLAWNDDDEYITFFDTLWPHLNPSGGLMVFHNTVAVEEAWNAIATIKQKRSAHGDLEVLTLPEPHKLSQSSCTILRRTTNYEPSFAKRTRERVVDDLLGFMQGNAGQKNESA